MIKMKISRTIMVSNNTAYIDAPIYLYKGDGNVLISLDIINITISTKLNQMSTTNYINDNISYATACLCKRDSSSIVHIVGTKVNDKIELEFKKEIMDETIEVGEYMMQVHLFDKENNRLTIPIVEEINIMLPLCSDGYAPPIAYSSKIGEATVDYSKVVAESMSASSDFYHTYNWTTGEYITANKLNNMITGIDEALYDIKNIQNNYVTKSELNEKANKNEIPTKISQLLNDEGYLTEHQDLSNYATKSYVDSEIANAQLGEDVNINLNDFATKDELNEKANKNDIPTKLSELQNDVNFISSIPSEYVTETELNNKGYLTQHQDLSEYATKNYVKNEIANAQLGGGDTEIDLSGYATKDDLNNKADKSSIPTKVSQLENDSNYLTNIPEEYITNEELNNKGYLTEHQDLSDYPTKDELNDAIESVNVSEQLKDFATKEEVSKNTNDINKILEIIDEPPTYVNPTLTISSSSANIQHNKQTNVVLTPKFTQNDAGAIISYSLSKDGKVLYTNTTASAYTDTITLQHGGSTKYTATVNYGDGVIKNTLLGIEYPSTSIKEGNISNNVTIRGYALSYYGVIEGDSISDTNGLSNVLRTSKGSTLTFNMTNQRVIYMYPKSFGNLTSIKDANNFDYINSYTLTNMTLDNVEYNVYILTDAVTINGFKQIFN